MDKDSTDKDEDISERVRVEKLETLSDAHYTLRQAHYAWRRRDGGWQEASRESYDIGDAAAVLPVDSATGKVVLIKQFRWPVYEWGYRRLLIETIAGKLDGDTPETCVMREAMEEAGVAISRPRLVTHCFVSPGAVKERVSMFLADYDSTAPRGQGGGHHHEGEDIEVLELPLDAALAMVADGEIVDLKTIMLLQAAKLKQR
jgi:nudix-type nucleoside diphosphatase (YffH/AdpP family)